MREGAGVPVAVASWNSAQFRDAGIESVLAQILSDCATLAVEAGSTDAWRGILNRCAASARRIQLVLIPHRLSHPTALSIGLARGKGGYVSPMQNDDLWKPRRIENPVV